jgi:hypothetical protein
MFGLRQRRPRTAAVTEFARALDTLDIPQFRAAKIFAVSERSLRRWRDGTRRVPRGIGILFRLLAAGVVTAVQVEEAAAAIPAPARTNGAKLEPPAEPAPERSALACAKTAALTDSGLSTAEKVLARAANTCSWPCGDPKSPNFFFCSRTTVREPYCEQHRAAAYMARRELIRPPPGLGSPAPGGHSRQPQASAARRMLRAAH